MQVQGQAEWRAKLSEQVSVRGRLHAPPGQDSELEQGARAEGEEEGEEERVMDVAQAKICH